MVWASTLFQFISVRSIGAGVTALLLGYILGPLIIRKLRQVGAKQAFRAKDEVGELANLHQNKEKTPTMGGLLICISVGVSCLLWAEPNVYVITALVTYLLLTIVGFLDDYLKVTRKDSKGLAGRFKLIGQLITTAIALFLLLGPFSPYMTGFHEHTLGSDVKMREFWIPFVSYAENASIPSLSLGVLFMFFLITLCGSSNAINLTDGLDGLAIGCTVTVALTYGIMAYAAGNYLIADYLKVRDSRQW